MFFIPFLMMACIQLGAAESRLILMRHGQAEHNVQDVYNANPNSSNYTPSHLTEEGEAQAFQTAQELLKQGFHPGCIDEVYVSPLPRTQETALILVKAGVISEDKIVVDHRLTEVQVGILEGKPIIRPWNEELTQHYQTETNEKIGERINAFAQERLASGKNILVVTHGVIAHELMKVMNVDRSKKIGTGEALILPCPAH